MTTYDKDPPKTSFLIPDILVLQTGCMRAVYISVETVDELKTASD